jgi:hypothetical protein
MRRSRAILLDHLVGGRKQSRRNLNAKFLRALEVDEQVEFGRLLEREFGGVSAVENFLQKARDAPERLSWITRIG